ncbi:MAG: FAD-dependent monooxygenase [Microbacteriaceae bacterium]
MVGGSLVGLTTSLLLSSYGIANLVVEKHPGTAIHPRAASFHQRTMEIYRHAGVQEAIEAAAALEFVQNGAIVAVESLRAKELQYFYKSWNEGVQDLRATSRLFITQVGLEPVLRTEASARGGRRTEQPAVVRDPDRPGRRCGGGCRRVRGRLRGRAGRSDHRPA